ncbi:MAG TPA: plastocyanin/azurin family copper-binding protein [Solirubrobacterales bacterium]|nr:plastocyanin/azurin family copper-binding protein [Solirubrobacterales bacterium]
MKKVASVLVLLLTSVALVACGSSSSSPSTSTSNSTTAATTPSESSTAAAAAGAKSASSKGSQTLKVEANPNGQLNYVPSKLTAKPGNVTIDFTNPQGLSHDISVEDSSGKTIGKSELIAESSTSLSLSNLKSGTYHYYCSVPGHREAGMEGTLTVK